MISKFKRLSFLIFFLAVCLPSRVAFADVGPKPTMEFTFAQTGNLTITSGILYECKKSDCSDAYPLRELGPQGLTCQPDKCRALAYGFAPYHRLEITFSDGKTRASDVFETAGFDSLYMVTVREDDLLVEAQFTPATLAPVVIIALVCACSAAGGGLLAALVIFIIRRSKKK